MLFLIVILWNKIIYRRFFYYSTVFPSRPSYRQGAYYIVDVFLIYSFWIFFQFLNLIQFLNIFCQNWSFPRYLALLMKFDVLKFCLFQNVWDRISTLFSCSLCMKHTLNNYWCTYFHILLKIFNSVMKTSSQMAVTYSRCGLTNVV